MTQWTRTTAASLRIQRLRASEDAQEQLDALRPQRPLLTPSISIDKSGKNPVSAITNPRSPQLSESQSEVLDPLLNRLRSLSRKQINEHEPDTTNETRAELEYRCITSELHRISRVQSTAPEGSESLCNPLQHLIEGSGENHWQPVQIVLNPSRGREFTAEPSKEIRPQALREAYQSPGVYRNFVHALLRDGVPLAAAPAMADPQASSRPKLVRQLPVHWGHRSAKPTASADSEVSQLFLSLLK